MTGSEKHEDQSGHHHMKADPTVYTCPMHPEIRSASPGTCPKCGMKLVPVAMTEGGMDHHAHAMKPASEMSRWERFKMSMTMTMGMEHTGVEGREMAQLMELDPQQILLRTHTISPDHPLLSSRKIHLRHSTAIPDTSSLASLPPNNAGILLLGLDLPLLKLQSSPGKNAEHVSSHRNGHNRRVQLQRSPDYSAERRFLLRGNRPPRHLRTVRSLVG